jgi:hypothetical protein
MWPIVGEAVDGGIKVNQLYLFIYLFILLLMTGQGTFAVCFQCWLSFTVTGLGRIMLGLQFGVQLVGSCLSNEVMACEHVTRGAHIFDKYSKGATNLYRSTNYTYTWNPRKVTWKKEEGLGEDRWISLVYESVDMNY